MNEKFSGRKSTNNQIELIWQSFADTGDISTWMQYLIWPIVFVLCYVPFEIISLMETSPLAGEDSKTMEHNFLLELFTKKIIIKLNSNLDK